MDTATGVVSGPAVKKFESLPIVKGVVTRLGAGESLSVGSLIGCAPALLAAHFRKKLRVPLLLLAAHPRTAESIFEDLQYFQAKDALLFPVLESLTEEGSHRQAFYAAERWDLLRALHKGEAGIIVSSVQALLQAVPAFEDMERAALHIKKGQALGLDEVMRWLGERGFETVPMVESPGDMSRRGGILDVYDSPTRPPVRIEFDGDCIDSLREFSPGTQTSIQHIESVTLSSPLPARDEPTSLHCLLDLLPPGAILLLHEMHEIQQEAGRAHVFTDYEWRDISPRLTQGQYCLFSGFPLVDTELSLNLPLQSTSRFQCGAERIGAELGDMDEGDTVEIACFNDAERDRLREILDAAGLAGRDIRLTLGQVSAGLRSAEAGATLLSSQEILRRSRVVRRVKRTQSTAPLASFNELEEGDLVVHINYGIGRFLGMTQMTQEDIVREFFLLEYRDNAKLYVPVTNIELIQKYIGGREAQFELDRIGGGAWKKRKAQVARQLKDIADDLVQTHARRETLPGYHYPQDDHWQLEFEAQFPFEETPDQLEAAAAIKEDLQRPRPMDRLLCGDVGFGKTEVAMRAAFKVAASGRQVGVLAPTTILTQQHFKTFSERMAAYPIRVDFVSRFKSPKENKRTIEDAREGRVDILIGTHRILSKDVGFKNLGLLIVDEEQRFGVTHKERLKALKADVDVLTLSATPIPRTLHQSLVGIKSISTLHTPPSDRVAVHTEIMRYDRARIRGAIQYELERGGQVFFVHNRVKDIEALAAEIAALAPGASIGVAHGQMDSTLLEERMRHFLEGGYDILLSTTIIENGVDMPNVNTLFVNNATHFGLAELHQLRGRVGRYKYRAYAYFLLPENDTVPPDSLRRLRAIEEYNELGAGYKIAMRDLELRGAGNLLGVEQSGHIKNVGYDLYCKLLRRALEEAARRAAGQDASSAEEDEARAAEFILDVKLDTCIPVSYIADLPQRIDMYRKISGAEAPRDIAAVREEIRDRFGPPPPVIQVLFDLAAMRRTAIRHGISRVMMEDGNLVFLIHNFQKASPLFYKVQDRCNLVGQNKLILYLRPADRPKSALLKMLKKVLLNTQSV